MAACWNDYGTESSRQRRRKKEKIGGGVVKGRGMKGREKGGEREGKTEMVEKEGAVEGGGRGLRNLLWSNKTD